jgi:hypothetical protein
MRGSSRIGPAARRPLFGRTRGTTLRGRFAIALSFVVLQMPLGVVRLLLIDQPDL